MDVINSVCQKTSNPKGSHYLMSGMTRDKMIVMYFRVSDRTSSGTEYPWNENKGGVEKSDPLA